MPLNKTLVNEGENARFYCHAIGVGASYFEYQWFLNRELVSQNRSLIIDNVLVSDTGDYICFVRNQYGGIGQSEKSTLILGGNKYIAKTVFSKWLFLN